MNKYCDVPEYIDDTFRSLKSRFKDRDEFVEFYNSLEDDSVKNDFLRIGSSYLFFVKNGFWHVNVPRSNEIIEYFNNSYKLIATIGLIESLSSEKFRDFHTWLVMRKNNVKFPIENKETLHEHYKKYKMEHGAIKKCISFFEGLSESTKNEIYKLIKIQSDHIDNIKTFVEMLYAARSQFAHESSMSLEIGDWYHLGNHDGKAVLWRRFKLKYLLAIFEEGVIAHFEKFSDKKLHNKSFEADSLKPTVG